MATLIIVVHIFTCIFLIMFVLLQAGKGAEIGATFGGVSQTFFGTQGGNIMSKVTTILAFVFMLTSIGLTALQHRDITESVMDSSDKTETVETVKKEDNKTKEQTEPVKPEESKK